MADWSGDSGILSLPPIHPRLDPQSASRLALTVFLSRLGVLVPSESPVEIGDGIPSDESILANSDPTKRFFPLLESEIFTDPPFLEAGLVLTFARDRSKLQVDGSDMHEQPRAKCNL